MALDSVVFRCDANVAAGTGHVMRCVALAQAWQDAGGQAVFAMAETTAALGTRLADESCEVFSVSGAAGTESDSRQTIALARDRGAEWIVVDGYQFTAEYQHALKAAGLKVLFVDDYGHAAHYSADVVLNQNAYANEGLYQRRGPLTRLLLGPRYCLLRREFSAWRSWKRNVLPVCRRALAIMGGSDPENLTARAIEALAGFEDIDATIVVGGSNPNFTTLQNAAARSGRKMTARRDVSNMAEIFAETDVAISAAGSICWELCMMGLPAMLIDVADNQTAIATELARRGCAIHAGDRKVSAERLADQLKRLAGSHEIRQSLSQRSRELVDGYGALRVVSVLRRAEGVRLRRARAEDMRLLWEWANDPEVRAASFSADPIPWETHTAWFAEKFSEKRSLIFIAEDGDGTPYGQIRFDLNGGEAFLNISLAKERRGIGLAIPLIETGVRELFANSGCETVHAFVKIQNAASARAFERAGFARVGVEQVRENTAVHFTCSRR